MNNITDMMEFHNDYRYHEHHRHIIVQRRYYTQPDLGGVNSS